MTELEKRQLGQAYNANYDPEITRQLKACKELCYDYNFLRPSQEKERNTLLQGLLGSIGSILAIESPFFCDFGYNIHIGENFYSNHGLVILDGAEVRFGHNVFIAPNCGFYTASHPIDAELRRKGLEFAHPITVGNDVWIGGGCQILGGVTIGNNVVIGAGSVVTKDIPSDVVAVGNPCRVLRPITKEDQKRG